eukprot:CFRG5515T1
MTILFLVKGTRGDVVPVVRVAEHVRNLQPVAITKRVVIATHHSFIHARHKSEIDGLFFTPIDSPQIESNENKTERVHQERMGCWSICQEEKPKMIIFNMFSLEGFSMAERLGVPSLCVSTYIQPSAAPAGFFSMLESECKPLFDALNRSESPEISIADVKHWFWRCFLDDIGSFRESVLGLSPLPFDDVVDAVIQGTARLPNAPLVLYGLSAIVYPPTCDWVPSAKMTGYWLEPECDQSLPTEIDFFLTSHDHVAFISFGSMVSLGVINSEETDVLLSLAVTACLRLGVCVLVQIDDQTTPVPNLQRMIDCINTDCSTKVLLVRDYISHSTIFCHCDVVVSHGGAGTVATALYAGVPQITIPLMFDQFFVGTRLVALGAGIGMDKHFGSHDNILLYGKNTKCFDDALKTLISAIHTIMTTSKVKESLENVQIRLREERNGVQVAAEYILGTM